MTTEGGKEASLVERLESNAELVVCPYDRQSPKYWTAPDDAPCEFCGQLNDPDAPIVCTGADLRIMKEAAARIRALEDENEQLRLAILGGEDAPGYASSLPLATVLQVHQDNRQTARRDSDLAWDGETASSWKAQASTYREALEGARDFAAHHNGCASYQMTAKGSSPCDCGHDDVFQALSSSHGGGNG